MRPSFATREWRQARVLRSTDMAIPQRTRRPGFEGLGPARPSSACQISQDDAGGHELVCRPRAGGRSVAPRGHRGIALISDTVTPMGGLTAAGRP